MAGHRDQLPNVWSSSSHLFDPWNHYLHHALNDALCVACEPMWVFERWHILIISSYRLKHHVDWLLGFYHYEYEFFRIDTQIPRIIRIRSSQCMATGTEYRFRIFFRNELRHGTGFLIDNSQLAQVCCTVDKLRNTCIKWIIQNSDNIYIYIYIYIYMLATVVEGDQKVPFSIATSPRCWVGRNSFSWIAPLYPWYVPYSADC